MRLLACCLSAAVLAALLLAPPALAAPARLGLEFPPLPALRPGEERTFDGNLTYHFDAPSQDLTNLTLRAEAAPLWLSARVEPGSTTVAATDPSGRTVVPVRLTVGVAPRTGALEQHALVLRAEAGANAPLEPTSVTTSVPVRVAFAPNLTVEVSEQPGPGKPGEPLTVSLRLRNDGNGPVRVGFEAAPTEGVSIVAPAPLLVESRGDLQQRIINVSLLPTEPGSHLVTLQFRSTHAFDATRLGNGGEVSFTLDVQPSGLLPEPDVALLALAAVALAWARRRRLT